MRTPRIMLLVMAAVSAGAARADLVFSQPVHPNAANVGFGYYSQSAPKPTRNYLHADNVTLASAAQVDKVVWWGMSEGVVKKDLSNFTSFQVKFWTAHQVIGQWLPFQVIANQTFTLAATNPTLTGRTAATNGAFEYRHEASLSSPVALSAGTRYFVSIGAGFVSGTGDAWLWQDSNTTEKNSAIYSYSAASWSHFFDTDSALELHTVPSPGAPALAAAALWGCAASRRRRTL